MQSVSVYTDNNGLMQNTFETFWEEAKIKIGGGLDFDVSRGKNIIFKYTRLQHKPYQLKIKVIFITIVLHITAINFFKVHNGKSSRVGGTVRIFLAPQYTDRGSKWDMSEQRNMFIELDKFYYDRKH
jgi:Hemocyanin, ig-like domain